MMDVEREISKKIFLGIAKSNIKSAQTVLSLQFESVVVDILDMYNHSSVAILLLKFKLARLTRIMFLLTKISEGKTKYPHGTQRVANILSAKNNKEVEILSKEIVLKVLLKLVKSGHRKTAVEIFKLLSEDKKIFTKIHLEKALSV